MKINYNDRKFRPLLNSENGEVSEEMIFHYKQENDILTCSYRGENIIKGHLLGIVETNGTINMCYHQVNKKGVIMTGICQSRPELLPNGKIRIYEEWQWTSGDKTKGESILEEV